MEFPDYVICKLTEIIELKCNSLELVFLEKFGQFSFRYDKDIKFMKESLKKNMEKTNRHIDESIFTILHKEHRFECDLEKIYKKLLTLFVQPNQQRITKTIFLQDKDTAKALHMGNFKVPECNCVQDLIPCDFENKNKKCCCLNKKAEQNDRKYCEDDKEESKGPKMKYMSPMKRKKLEAKNLTASLGRSQSPIALLTDQAIQIYMPAIEMIGYQNLLPAPIYFSNTGQTVKLSIRNLSLKEIKLKEFIPYIKGGKLDCAYEFEYVQFHWGDDNTCGAEHVVNGAPCVMEMQIIHRNKKYDNIDVALGYSDGIAALSFLYRISECDAPELETIVKNIPNVACPCDIVEMDTTFSLNSLIRNICLDRFYMYRGSLTFPPYPEVVTWIVFPDPLKISSSQISKFRKLAIASDENCECSNANWRELQPLGNRRVFLRDGFVNGRSIDNLDKVHYRHWKWNNV